MISSKFVYDISFDCKWKICWQQEKHTGDVSDENSVSCMYHVTPCFTVSRETVMIISRVMILNRKHKITWLFWANFSCLKINNAYCILYFVFCILYIQCNEWSVLNVMMILYVIRCNNWLWCYIVFCCYIIVFCVTLLYWCSWFTIIKIGTFYNWIQQLNADILCHVIFFVFTQCKPVQLKILKHLITLFDIK